MKTKDVLLIALQNNKAADYLNSLLSTPYFEDFYPELIDSIFCAGGNHHAETVFIHLLDSLRAVPQEASLELKLAALLHDIGKPTTKVETVNSDGQTEYSFHKHEIVGATIAYKFCKKKLYLPEKSCQYITKLVRNHMFYVDELASDKAVCRWLYKIGKGTFPDLIELRKADRLGNSANKGKPAVTMKMKELCERVDGLVSRGTIIFREDVNISEKEIQAFAKDKQDIDEIYFNLIGLLNTDKTRNTYEYLSDYMRRIYGRES